MKKTYSTPELEYIELETADMIAENLMVVSGPAQDMEEEDEYNNGGDGFAKFNNFPF